VTATDPTTTDPNAAANDLPAWARKPVVTAKLLKADATGADVGALQKALGLPVTGTYDAATVEGVKAWQKAHNLGDDGIAGRKTLTALGLVDDLRSRYHDNTQFVPEYRATAYSESDEHRKATDPYAVGSITHPNQGDDDGGKTYGTYQFESYVYADGTQKKGSVDSSTVMRFVNNADNPYSAQLKKVVADHGVASAEFDALWGQLSKDENKAFGKAQEAFLKSEYAPKVKAFFDKANVPEAIRADPDLYDVTMGTVNQYGGLANHISDAVAEAQKASKTPLTAKQIGRIMQETKAGHVTDWFRSSPNAWAGIRDRVSREGKLFAE